MWNFHIIAFCFYSQFVQCPNFFGIRFVDACNKIVIYLQIEMYLLILFNYTE